MPGQPSAERRAVLLAVGAGISTAVLGGVLLIHTANAVVAAATAAQAAAVVGALWFARRQLEDAAATRREQARPYVVVYLDVPPDLRQFPNIVVANLGLTAAYDVTLSFDPPLRSSMDKEGGLQLADVGMLKNGIPTLAPSMRLATVFDYMVDRPPAWEQSHEASVTYRDRHDEQHSDRFVIDLSTYRSATWIDRKGLHQLNEEVKGLRDELHNLRTGWSEPMPVVVEDRATRIERRETERAEAIERHERAQQQRAEQLAGADAGEEKSDADPDDLRE